MALPIVTESFGRFERLSLVTRRATRGGVGGEHRSRHPSPSTDFVDYRPYQTGDDFRRVDWNVYGRLGSLQVKVTEGRERLDVLLVLDCSSSMANGQPDKLAFAAQLLGALGYIGVVRADAVRIACLTPSRDMGFGPFRRRGRMADLVNALATVAPTGLVDLNARLADCLPEGARQPLVIVASDLMTPDGVADGLLALQSRHADVVVLHVVSPDELEPDLAGEVELIDAETNASLELGVSLDTLRAYRQRLQTWLAAREADCITHGMRYVRLMTDRPLADVIMDDLRRGGVLR